MSPALGQDGGDHTMTMLKHPLKQVMVQVGCERVAILPKHFVASNGGDARGLRA